MARKYGLFINGQYVHSENWRPVPSSIDPSNIIAEYSLYLDGQDDSEIYEACLEGVSQTFGQIQDGYFPLQERLEFLSRLQNRLKAQKENIAQIIMQEVGKPISLARSEVTRAIDTIEWTLNCAPKLLSSESDKTERRLPTDQRDAWKHYQGNWQRVPRGPLLAITPFNFPLNLAMHKLAPAIAAGCPIILKPSPKSAMTALCLADYCQAENLPAGMLNVFNCDDSTTKKLILDNRVAQISFTGSDKVGWSLKELTPKPFILELGGAAPAYVDENSNLEEATRSLAISSMAFAGQVCISTQNIHIHKNAYAKFKTLFEKELSQLKAGSPAIEDVLLGPLVDDATYERVLNLERTLKQQGLTVDTIGATISSSATINDVLYAGEGWKKRFLEPRIVAGFAGKEDFLTKECFAPFVGLIPTENLETFVLHANELKMRLQCSLWTNNTQEAHAAAKRLQYGGVMINESPSVRLEPMPYGGMGQSGFGREGPEFAIEEFCEKRVILEKKI